MALRVLISVANGNEIVTTVTTYPDWLASFTEGIVETGSLGLGE